MILDFLQVISLEPAKPYDFRLTLRELKQYPLDVTERIIGNTLLRGFRLENGTPVLAAIRSEDNTSLIVDVYGEQEADTEEILHKIRQVLNLDLDLASWYSGIETTDPMNRITEQLRGLRPVVKPTIFESLVTAILEQQLNVRFACTLETRLIQTYGTKLTCDQGIAWLFPTPESLASLEPDALRTLQISRAKAKYIIGLAQLIMGGEIDPESWHDLDGEQLIQRLMEIHGVGRWTAEYVAMIGYRRFNHAPAADIGLRNAVTALTNEKDQLSEVATREYMNRWDQYKGLATIYIWHAYTAGIIEEINRRKS